MLRALAIVSLLAALAALPVGAPSPMDPSGARDSLYRVALYAVRTPGGTPLGVAFPALDPVMWGAANDEAEE